MTLHLGRWRVVLRDGTVQVWDTASPYYDPHEPVTTARWSPALGCHEAHGASLREGTWADIDEAIARALDPSSGDPNHNL